MRFYLLNVNSFYLYKFLQAGGDCFRSMVIISKGLVNIDAKIFGNTDRYDMVLPKMRSIVFFYDRSFSFFLIFRKKTNAVKFHVNLYFFCGCANFFLKNEKYAC